jgi:hypothetical protein
MALDSSRQHDVRDIQQALANGSPKEKAAANKALEMIKREQNNPKVLDARRWMLKELEHGRFENVRNFYEDQEKDPRLRNE